MMNETNESAPVMPAQAGIHRVSYMDSRAGCSVENIQNKAKDAYGIN
ncbi:MAG: hypothetical protein H6657_29250 [Ardenticatenaceae bacterium]|nr:hypothetical protein [Ardenticatenaceae bacterium]